MALVVISAIRAGSFEAGQVRGRPGDVKKITSVPSSFGSAGSPDWQIPDGTEALIFVSDTPIDLVVVRKNNPPTVETPWSLPVASGGISQFVVSLEDGDSDIFIRTLA